MKQQLRRTALPLAAAIATLVAAWLALRALGIFGPAMLVAPMIGLEPCLTPAPENTADEAMMRELATVCAGPEGSAAQLVESTLRTLEGGNGDARAYPVGYTLNVPLLRLFVRQGQDWVIDQDLVGRIVRTVRDNPRPLVLYLFSTHFSQGAPIEEVLAADPANLSWTPAGPLATSRYYGAPLYNWSFASFDTPLTRRRIEAARAVLEAVCRLPEADRARIRGITLLGELHHLFPDFEAGMGFQHPYLVSDYSETSRAGFRAFLRERFLTVEALNRALGSQWKSFDEIEPPARDIRKEPLRDYTEHIDAYAHGWLPVSGWAWVEEMRRGETPWIRIYRNGRLVARTPVDKGRQDVLAAVPELGTANTGWRYDLDFRQLPTGLHRIDAFLERPDGLVHLGTRRIAIMDRSHRTPAPMPEVAPPDSRPPAPGERFYMDWPQDLSSYFYNPMVPLWHEFRGQQVVRYLQRFRAATEVACLAGTPRYTHQIIPFTNPSWDTTRFAMEPSLARLPGLRLGISLYGEPTYGHSILQWLDTVGHPRYGITEFHPLKPLDAAQMRGTFERHARRGAQFLSFFMEPRWEGRRASRHVNLFSLDPDNPAYGSDQSYLAVRAALRGEGR